MTRRPPHLLALAILLACGSETTAPALPVPATVQVVTGDAQEAIAGMLLPRPVALRVMDRSGRPLAAADVRVQVVAGGGSVTPATVRTDSSGVATVQWRLGLATRAQALEAGAGEAPVAVVHATATGAPTEVSLALPADSMLVGDSMVVGVRIVDNFGEERPDFERAWLSETPELLAVDDAGRLRALGDGVGRVRLRVHDRLVSASVRLRDVPSSLRVEGVLGGVAVVRPMVDIEETMRFRTRVLGRTGRVLPESAGPVTWSCEGPAVWVRCDSVLVPRLQPVARPETVTVVARAAGFTGRLPVVVHEAVMLDLEVSWPPAPVLISDTVLFAQTAEATLGDTLRLLVGILDATRTNVGGFEYYAPRLARPIRVQLDDPALATATLGDTVDEKRVLKVVGLREGTTRMRVMIQGHAAGFNLRVRARSPNPCATTVGLDLALGELRTLRGSDAAQCLRFERARDAGRVYLVVTDAMPRETSRPANLATEFFNFEGQALFQRSSAPVPRAMPTMRFHPPVAAGTPAPLAERQAPAEGDGGVVAWRVGGMALREHAPVMPARGAALSREAVSGFAAVGDTIDLGPLAYFDPRFRTQDGGPRDNRAVIVYMGQRLVAAELLDVLRGRLVSVDGSQPARIPTAQFAAIEVEYVLPSLQLDRLFPGTPGQLVAYGRDFGTRELFVNVPLQVGIAGYASGSYVAVHYWVTGSTPPPARQLATGLLTHEFAHVRHLRGAHAPAGPWHPWLVEGLAKFAERLAVTATMLRDAAPPRTARLETIGDPNALPGGTMSHLTSFFAGYDASSYVFDYLADHTEARGGDWTAAVRGLAAAGSAQQADAAVGAALPGMTALDLVVRARLALALEQLRLPGCTGCIAPDPSLPAWTRYLQYDLPKFPFFRSWEDALWPVARPGQGRGAVFTQRTGSWWPMLIDGRDARADETWVLDFADAPQTTVSVVRIR